MRRAFLAIAILLTLPAGAQAAGFERAYRDFKEDGALQACAYSDRELAEAERDTPADVEQYTPAFTEQLRNARLARGRGECGGARQEANGVPAGVAIPAVDTSAGASTPAAVWILAVVAGIALVALFLWLLGRRYGWCLDRFTRPFRAAVSEATERTADLARDFWDWLRLGR